VEETSRGLEYNLLREARPAGAGCSGSHPAKFLILLVLTINFEYSFDAGKHERKHFKIGPHDYKTRELTAKLDGASNTCISWNFF